jgi:hypothetical protein
MGQRPSPISSTSSKSSGHIGAIAASNVCGCLRLTHGRAILKESGTWGYANSVSRQHYGGRTKPSPRRVTAQAQRPKGLCGGLRIASKAEKH